MIELALGIWSWISRTLAAIGRWLRAPHDWWRIGFFVMGLVAMIAACGVWDRQNALQTAVALREADARTCAAQLDTLNTALAGYASAASAIAEANRAEAARLAVAQQQAAEALADVATEQAKAAKDNAAWWAKYQQRPQTCAAAQQALDTACAGIEDY